MRQERDAQGLPRPGWEGVGGGPGSIPPSLAECRAASRLLHLMPQCPSVMCGDPETGCSFL